MQLPHLHVIQKKNKKKLSHGNERLIKVKRLFNAAEFMKSVVYVAHDPQAECWGQREESQDL